MSESSLEQVPRRPLHGTVRLHGADQTICLRRHGVGARRRVLRRLDERAERRPGGRGGPSGCGGNTSGGSFGSGGASGSASGGGAVSGGQGVTEVTSEPPPCTTEDGANGILIDPFPYPSPKVSCKALDQPGKLDSQCPSDPFVSCSLDDCVLDSPLPGCCRPDGSCGLLDQGRFSAEKSLGCISRDEWIANAPWLGGDQVAVACSP